MRGHKRGIVSNYAFVPALETGQQKHDYASQDLRLSHFSTGYLLRGTGESEPSEAKV